MKHDRAALAAFAAARTRAQGRARRLCLALLILLGTTSITQAGNLRVLKTGIGDGTITVTGAGITDCANACGGAFTDDAPLTFTATAPAGSAFLKWEGSVNSRTNPLTTRLRGDHRVRAVFVLLRPVTLDSIPIIDDFTPEGLRTYFRANPYVNTPARFIAALPRDFRRNWILMTRSESLQTGTAFSPRLLLPDATGKFVFTIGLQLHRSYPGSHPLAVEYMQWDADQRNFRFHEVVLGDIPAMQAHAGINTFPARNRAAIDFISIDDKKCSRCHSTRNVLNTTGSIGTTGSPIGLVQAKSKPNWDTYDSWAGMLAFNRDRIYRGSIEAAAFRYLFNPWSWEALPAIREVMEQLELQPPRIGSQDLIFRIAGGPNDGRVVFAFDPLAERPVRREPYLTSDTSINTNYSFNGQAGTGATTQVYRSPTPYVTLRHSEIPTTDDEGRGVHLFDLLGGINTNDPLGNLNAQRVADEVVHHRYITGSHYLDPRPITLAIARGLLRINFVTRVVEDNLMTVTEFEPQARFFDARNGPAPGRDITQVYADTRDRAFSLPRRKADLQFFNLSRWDDPYLFKPRIPSALNPPAPADGLLAQFDSLTSVPAGLNRMDSTRREVFRRPIDRPVADRTVMDSIYVDREEEVNLEQMALFRYYLEPLGISVDKWNMGVRGRSRAYTFADVFDNFLPVLRRVLADSLTRLPVFDPELGRDLIVSRDSELIRAVNISFRNLPMPADVPTFVDVQRIFNKACIECHGGLEYPPYSNYTNGRMGFLDFSENDTVGRPRLARSHDRASRNALFILDLIGRTSEAYNVAEGMMPFGGPALSQTDIETVRRWVGGGSLLTTGDPHVRTIDGTDYDFQAAGEYVLLRGEFFELQARQKAISTDYKLGPNAHTGLTTCVSVNTGMAVRLGDHRITYLPKLGNEMDASGMELRVDGRLETIPAVGLAVAPGTRVVRTGTHGIRIEAPGGTVLSVSAAFWDHFQTWIMDIHVHHARGHAGVMGSIAPGSWLPYLPNGSSVGPMPDALTARAKVLYGVFAPAWLVQDSSSLFDYAPGKSTASYRLPTWPRGESPKSCILPAEPGEPQPLPGMTREEAEKLCTEIGDARLREFCIQDLMTTGARVFVDNYRETDKVLRNQAPARPKLVFPANDAQGLSLPIDFQWEAAADADSDAITYRHLVWPVHEGPDTNLATPVGGKGGNAKRCAFIALLIGLAVWLLLYFLFRKKLGKAVWVLLFLLVLLIAGLAYYLCGRSQGNGLQTKVDSLPGGMAYYWKVIAEDGKGGITESETYRFEVR